MEHSIAKKVEFYFVVFGWKFNLKLSKRRGMLTWYMRMSYLGFSSFAGAVSCSSLVGIKGKMHR